MPINMNDSADSGNDGGGEPGRRRTGLRVRRFLPLILLLGLLGPFLASTWYTLSLERQSLEDSFHRQFKELADVFAEGMSDPVWNLIPESGRPLIDSLLKDSRILHVTVTSSAQGMFLEGGAEPPGEILTELVSLRRDIVHGGTGIGKISMLVDASAMYRAMASQQLQIVAVGAGNVVLSLAIVLFVFRMTARLENESKLKALNRKLEAEITERRETESRLRESEARMKGIMENSPSGIFLKDLDGRYQLVNSRILEWQDLAEDEIIGKTTREIYPERNADAYVAHDRETLEQDGPVTRDHEVPWGDGSTRTVVSTKFPVRDSDGTLKGIGTLYTDVTDHRRAEEAARQAQKMQSIGQLTGGVAHDFNNLLAVIIGNAELLDENIKNRSGDDAKYLASIRRAVQRGKELTMRLLIFSRRQPLSPAPVDMEALATGMADLLGRTLGGTIEIRTECAQGDWQGMADPGQLENAILNLGINARDAMPGGGRITIRTGTATVRTGPEAMKLGVRVGDYVTVSVRDSGSGMSADTAEKAIEPFFTTKEVGAGTGLGLSMVYGFVKQSAGGMTIESREGKGTVITLYLPLARTAAREEDDERPRELPRGSGETILVVEDEADFRRVALAMLEGLGYRVILAEDARDGMARLATEDHIDLLLSDVVLPGGVSGPDLAEAAHAHRPGLKVLLMSGFADELVRNRQLPNGIRLINKPFELRELARRVQDELSPGTASAPS